MKKLIGYWIGIILISLSSLTLQAQDICIADSTASRIIDELIVKDYLEIKVVKQDSIITVLTRDLANREGKITIYKTNEEDFQKDIEKLNEIITIREAENKDLKSEIKAIKRKHTFIDIMVVIGAVAIDIIILTFVK